MTSIEMQVNAKTLEQLIEEIGVVCLTSDVGLVSAALMHQLVSTYNNFVFYGIEDGMRALLETLQQFAAHIDGELARREAVREAVEKGGAVSLDDLAIVVDKKTLH